MKKFIPIFLISFVFAVTNNITPKISRVGKTIGDKINYSFTIDNFSLIPSFNLSFKDPSKNEDILVVTQSIKNKNNKLFYRAEIISFKTGKIVFPSFNILENYIQSIAVTVDSVLKPKVTPNFIENYPPYSEYSDLILLVIILVMILAGYYSWKTYQQKQEELKKILTPEQKHNLWVELKNIFTQENIENIKLYYFNSSEKLKLFVEKVLGLKVTELTTRELKEFIRDKELLGKDNLFDALESTDLVKFAKYIPTAEEIKNYQKTALQFLEKHEPKTETPNA